MAVRPPLREGVRKRRRDTLYLLQLKQRFPTLFLLPEQYGKGFRTFLHHEMKITTPLFEAGLKCITKCFLLITRRNGDGERLCDWVRTQAESYRNTGMNDLMAGAADDECIIGSPGTGNWKTAKWRFAMDFVARAQNLESRVSTRWRDSARGTGKSRAVHPIRFIFTNKLTKDDKLLLAYDALVLSEMLGPAGQSREDHPRRRPSTLKVKTPSLRSRVRQTDREDRRDAFRRDAPDLVLNRHCGECEFQDPMQAEGGREGRSQPVVRHEREGAQETQQQGHLHRHATLLHLPAAPQTKAPARQAGEIPPLVEGARDSGEEDPHRRHSGTEDRRHAGLSGCRGAAGPGFLLPHRRAHRQPLSAVQHSLWADHPDEERRIWTDLLSHPIQNSQTSVAPLRPGTRRRFSDECVNATETHRKLQWRSKPLQLPCTSCPSSSPRLFPWCISNGLKAVAGWLGFEWLGVRRAVRRPFSGAASGKRSRRDSGIKQKLITELRTLPALELVTHTVHEICGAATQSTAGEKNNREVIQVDSMKEEHPYRFGTPSFVLPAMSEINKASVPELPA